jgi:hypothetical protein
VDQVFDGLTGVAVRSAHGDLNVFVAVPCPGLLMPGARVPVTG